MRATVFISLFLLPAAGAFASKLSDGLALYQARSFQPAREKLLEIKAGEPGFSEASAYRALALYEMKEDKRFLKQVEILDVATTVSLEKPLKEELAWKYAAASVRQNNYTPVIPRVEAFEKEFPQSPKLAELREYKMAALFKRGRKAAQEALKQADAEKKRQRDDLARLQLAQFLAMALARPDATYAHAPREDLKSQIDEARLLLGDEDKMLAEMPQMNPADREKFAYVRIQLQELLHPDETEEAIKMAESFIADYPKSNKVGRAYVDLATLHFRRGEKLHREGKAKSGTSLAEGTLTASHREFVEYRQLMETIDMDPAAGIEKSDVLDLQRDLLYSYFIESDNKGLLNAAQAMAKSYPAGDPAWATAKMYEGIALYKAANPNVEAAKTAFEAAMTIGLTGQTQNDRLYTEAAFWRINIANDAGDESKVASIVDFVSKSKCEKNIKERFLSRQMAGLDPDEPTIGGIN